MKSIDAAWTAGLLEGDSSEWNPTADFFGVRRRDRELLLKLQRLWGGKVVHLEDVDKFEWQLPAEEARAFLQTIGLHLCKGTRKYEMHKKLYEELK